MKTIFDIIHHDSFTLQILDSNGFLVYYEDVTGFWVKRRFDSNGNTIYYESSRGLILDDR